MNEHERHHKNERMRGTRREAEVVRMPLAVRRVAGGGCRLQVAGCKLLQAVASRSANQANDQAVTQSEEYQRIPS